MPRVGAGNFDRRPTGKHHRELDRNCSVSRTCWRWSQGHRFTYGGPGRLFSSTDIMLDKKRFSRTRDRIMGPGTNKPTEAGWRSIEMHQVIPLLPNQFVGWHRIYPLDKANNGKAAAASGSPPVVAGQS